ncbi:ImmA/IrrE family metallo-endopeptidase [Desulfovibrio sp.]|uniref:ImmA/IrrE family metallo-endopeptidase n=1 Tax=Desulfovibrio sp. TaxID=885 RepID=UPI00258CF8E2|nr:ImmA/IrrE family metallo-endopeptidase [Desulfovibrio sp.]
MMMPDPAGKARWVLETKNITGIPALALHDIAKSEKIPVRMEAFPDEPGFSGELLFKGDRRAIIVNTHIPSPQRHTFTFAHELGHYFLGHAPTYEQDDAAGILCTAEGIKTGSSKMEREANTFAVELLMPENRFLPMMFGAAPDFALIKSLARQFQVSKQACGYRILDFTREQCAILYSENARISGYKVSRSGKGFLRNIKQIPQGTLAHEAISTKQGQETFQECDPEKWLVRYTALTQLYSCTRGIFEKGLAMTILRWS